MRCSSCARSDCLRPIGDGGWWLLPLTCLVGLVKVIRWAFSVLNSERMAAVARSLLAPVNLSQLFVDVISSDFAERFVGRRPCRERLLEYPDVAADGLVVQRDTWAVAVPAQDLCPYPNLGRDLRSQRFELGGQPAINGVVGVGCGQVLVDEEFDHPLVGFSARVGEQFADRYVGPGLLAKTIAVGEDDPQAAPRDCDDVGGPAAALSVIDELGKQLTAQRVFVDFPEASLVHAHPAGTCWPYNSPPH